MDGSEHKAYSEGLNEIGLGKDKLDKMAKDAKFIVRNRKITASKIVDAYCSAAVKGFPSCRKAAAAIESGGGGLTSKQAVHKKTGASFLLFLTSVLGWLLAAKTRMAEALGQLKTPAHGYKRILIQDSTVIKLPAALWEEFSGVANKHGKSCNARIQAAYDLVSESFIQFSIDPYSKNDLSAAPGLKLQDGDLVLRDRGYFMPGEIKRHIDASAHCIYRFKAKTVLIDPQTNKRVNLLEALRGGKSIDAQFFLNNAERSKVRIAAVPISEKEAGEKRSRLIEDSKHSPSEESLALQSWAIFVTTIPQEEAGFEQLYMFYSLRWRIETIFKTWKSSLSFTKFTNCSSIQLRAAITARLIAATLVTQYVYGCYAPKIQESADKMLSLAKTVEYIALYPAKIPSLLRELKSCKEGLGNAGKALAMYCCYDKRKRNNFQQMYQFACP